MKKLLLLSALLIFACSSDDSSNNEDNSNQTFLEKYDGIIWEDITFDTSEGFRRYNNDPINWYTNFNDMMGAGEGCNNIGDAIDFYDLLNPENPYGFYYVIMINSEDVFQYNSYSVDANGLPQLGARFISTVIDNGNTLDFREDLPDDLEDGTASATFQRASNEFNDFADIQFPCP
jgi:hypothetical protein